jgi:general secretion pathway protein G
MKKAFSLVELMIVVAIIGILAALVTPKISNYAQQAKEAAARENLQTLRSAIELYASQHGGVPPGYANNDVSTVPNQLTFALQMLKATNASGVDGDRSMPGFVYGPYLMKLPKNPLTNGTGIRMVANGASLPTPTNKLGFIYQPSTKTVKLDKSGIDSKGMAFSDY